MIPSIDLRHVRSLTDFLRNHREHVNRLKEDHGPEVLTINGKPELVLQSAEGYQDMLDRLEYAESVAGLRKAYGQFREGMTVAAAEGFSRVRMKHGL